jgi:hypothetical protein
MSRGWGEWRDNGIELQSGSAAEESFDGWDLQTREVVN